MSKSDAFVFKPASDETSDAKHKDWIIIESMSSPIYRSMDDEQRDLAVVEDEVDATMSDSVALNFTKIEYDYGGSPKGNVEYRWHIEEGESYTEIEWTY